jgi:HK97 family phage portal protein
MRGIFGSLSRPSHAAVTAPRASEAGGTIISDLTGGELDAFLRSGAETHSGAIVTEAGAMRIAAAWRCIHILCGVTGNNPLDLYRRVNEDHREPATGHPLREVLTRRPNGWQTPSEFRKMLTAWTILDGNGYGLKITSMGRVLEIWPLNSRRVQPMQDAPGGPLTYQYTRKDGSQVTLQQKDMLHLRGLTLDGVTGLGVLAHARESMGLSMQGEKSAAKLFKQGVLAGGALKTPNALSDTAFGRLKESIEENNAGAENAHKMLILEEGLDAAQLSMTAEDAQFLETRKFQRSDIAMFFGVPPFLIGDVEKTTSWGSGIEQMGTAFVQYSAQDWITMWEEAIERDLLDPKKAADANVYALLDVRGLMRGDMNGRSNYYARALGSGGGHPWLTQDEVRALEDKNPLGGDAAKLPPHTPAAKDPNPEDPNAPKPDQQA